MLVPIRQKIPISDKEGNPTPPFEDYLDTLTQQMQLHLSDEGLAVPGATTAQIEQIYSDVRVDSQKPPFLLMFNTDTNELNIRDINGLRKVIPLQNP